MDLGRAVVFPKNLTRSKVALASLPAYGVVTILYTSGKTEPAVWVFAAAATLVALLSLSSPRPLRFLGASLALVSCAPAAQGRLVETLGLLSAAFASFDALALPMLLDPESELYPEARPRLLGPMVLLASGFAVALLAIGYGGASTARDGGTTARIFSALATALALATLSVVGFRQARLRHLELGAGLRSRTMGTVFALALFVSLLVAFGGFARPDRALRVGLAVAAIGGGFLVSMEAVALSRALRRVLVCVGLGAPVTLVLGSVADRSGEGAGTLTLVAGASALLLGIVLPRLERALLPLRGVWLAAVEHAIEGTTRTQAEDTLRTCLARLRQPFEPTLRGAAIWTLDPPLVVTVDGAGYLHARERTLPPGLVEFAAREPFATLRAEVLEVLEVRRAEFRPLAAWFREQEAHAVTVITLDGVPEAALVVPHLVRPEALTLEELSAGKALADRLGAAVATQGTRTRALLREQELTRRFENATDAATMTAYQAGLIAARNRQATARLARAATVGLYSAVAQLAQTSLDRKMKVGAPIVLSGPSGIDPVPVLARAFLGGPRRDAPFVVVDGTASQEHDLARWTDPRVSPLALVDGGLLLLLDVGALPTDVQELLARVHAERRPPWERAEPLEFQLAAFVTEPAEASRARLASALEARLAAAFDDPVRLPRLRDRAEDLRGILIDRLAREGLRVRGAPIGLHDSAYAELVDHPFEGEEAELHAIVVRLVARVAAGGVVRADDVRALGLVKVRAEPLRLVGSSHDGDT